MRREQANDAEAMALSSARVARLSDRLGRIERSKVFLEGDSDIAL